MWIKIGGDKGGGSFKFAFQLANLEKPNSTENTVVFTMFEASDSPHNLHIALDRYKEEIHTIQGSQWRYGEETGKLEQHCPYLSYAPCLNAIAYKYG